MVIADHNHFIRLLFKAEFRPLTLHVLGFFFLCVEVGALEVPALPRDRDIVRTHDIAVVAGFLALMLIARYANREIPVLTTLGRHSLLVYLVHPAVFFLVRMATQLAVPGFPAPRG